MYAWIWRHLPGSPPLRAVEALALVVLVVGLLLFVVFPWLSPMLPFGNVTVGAP